MLTHLDPALQGWLVVAVMISSGLVLGSISERLLRIMGVRDRGEG